MGYRYQNELELCGDADFRTMKVVLVKKGGPEKNRAVTHTMLVDNHGDTLRYTQEHMERLAKNVLRVKQLDAQERSRMEENAQLFENSLEPLFSLVSGRSERLLGTLSNSLKKALLLMAMDRYQCDQEEVCLALGISRNQLARELRNCGITPS